MYCSSVIGDLTDSGPFGFHARVHPSFMHLAQYVIFLSLLFMTGEIEGIYNWVGLTTRRLIN